jgi:hypothetical protein
MNQRGYAPTLFDRRYRHRLPPFTPRHSRDTV